MSLVDGLQANYEFHVASHGVGGVLPDACSTAGVPFHHLEHLVREIRPTRDTAALVELWRLVDRVRPDLVHLHSSKAGAVGRIALAIRSVPVVLTAHGWSFAALHPSARVFAAIERILAPLTDAIICVSKTDRRLALAHGVGRSDRLHVIHNGVVVPPCAPTRDPWPDRPRLACIARPSPQKDIPLLLESLSRPGLERWRLDVFGDGPDRAALEARVVAHDLAARVRLLGDRHDLLDLLPGYDALALPSNWEGFPMSILEAMAVGLPVVASDVGGVSEAVVDGETGTLVRRGDVGGFTAALRRLLEDGSWARSLGLAGHARVRRLFTIDTMLARYDAVFSSLVRV